MSCSNFHSTIFDEFSAGVLRNLHQNSPTSYRCLVTDILWFSKFMVPRVHVYLELTIQPWLDSRSSGVGLVQFFIANFRKCMGLVFFIFFLCGIAHNVFLNLSLSPSSTMPSSAMLSDILNISFSLFALSLQLLTKCYSFLSRPYPVPPHCGKSLSTFLVCFELFH